MHVLENLHTVAGTTSLLSVISDQGVTTFIDIKTSQNKLYLHAINEKDVHLVSTVRAEAKRAISFSLLLHGHKD